MPKDKLVRRGKMNINKELATDEVVKYDDIIIEENDERVKRAAELLKNIIDMEDAPNFLKKLCREGLKILSQKDIDFDIRRERIINLFSEIPEDLSNNMDSFTRILIFQLTASLEQL
ncbi:MAG TPA: hypothetical protein EYH54_05095 [Nautiliaceae bacterium]|nr:hypothetical protein [Nautiliaceae bacterium]